MGAFDRQAAADLYAAQPVPAWLDAVRRGARAEWLQAAWPDRKTEAWKYTGLDALADTDWLRRPAAATAPAQDLRIAGLDADYLVFVDGHYSAAQSSIAADSRWISRFAEAGAAERTLIEQHLGTLAAGNANPFVALGGCWTTDGVLVHVPRGQRVTRPICIVHAQGAGTAAAAWAQRALVVLGDRAEAEVIEYFPAAQAQGARALVTGGTEILLGEGARLLHRRLHLEGSGSLHFGGVQADLQRDAHYKGFIYAGGARLKRLDLRVRHLGQGSEALLDGVYLARETQHVDLHTAVEHAATHGTTHQVYRGLVDDAATAVFNGRILIQPGAQKTNADLANRNLLFSDRAEVDFKPELEIYADDVKCAHGATVSRVEERSLYYLQSRGIARREAEVLLAIGFVAELIGALGCAPLEALLRSRLRGWFGLADVELAA